MATSQMSGVIQHLRRTVLLRDGAGLTDGQLLEDYLSRRDQAALAALVHRHGPMVWGTCRRVLRDYHDAEDAFQTTFLVFVRKGASIASRELLANWLYGVAHQTALKARATAARRKGRERQVLNMPEPAVTEPDLWCDLQPLLDEELSRLPDKYRTVIVLCELEGKKNGQKMVSLGVASFFCVKAVPLEESPRTSALLLHGRMPEGCQSGTAPHTQTNLLRPRGLPVPGCLATQTFGTPACCCCENSATHSVHLAILRIGNSLRGCVGTPPCPMEQTCPRTRQSNCLVSLRSIDTTVQCRQRLLVAD